MDRKWVTLIFLLLLPACASLSSPSKEPNHFSQTHSTLNRHVLDNGLTVLLKEVHRTPVVSIMAYVKTGSAHEGVWNGSGISHAVEHMFFKGTETRGVGEIANEIRSYGGDINAFTSYDVTGYTLVASRDHYTEALELLADCLMHARFDLGEFQKEKEVILSEIRLGRDNPARRTSHLLWENAYQQHPYRHPVIGYETLLKELTREDLIQYHRQTYVPNNIILVLVGDIQNQEALAAVKEHFGSFRRASLPPQARVVEPIQRSIRSVRQEAPFQMAHLMMGYHTVSVTSQEMYPLDVLAILFGGVRSARLVELLQKEKELVYGVETSSYTPIDPGLFTISAILEEENIPETLALIRAEIDKIKSHPIRTDELEKAKQRVLSSFYFSQETIQSQARDLAGNEAAGLDPLFSERYVKAIAAVTKEDVQRAAKHYLKEENLTLVVLVPETPQDEKVKGLLPPAGLDRGVRKFVLPNGVRVLLQKDTAQPTVSLGIVMLGGLRFLSFCLPDVDEGNDDPK